jgi:hypothetical protein
LLASDVFGLIGALGKDCAGALVVQPQDEPPPTVPTTQDAEALSDDVSRWPASKKSCSSRGCPTGDGDAQSTAHQAPTSSSRR